VVSTCRFEKFLKMVLRRQCLVLEVTLSGCNALLTGGANFLIAAIIAGCHGDVARVPLQPLLVALGTLTRALGCGLRCCCLAIAGGRFHIA
jgi:hypothetical protein